MHTEIFLADGTQILPCLGEPLHVILAKRFHLLRALENLTDVHETAPQLQGYKFRSIGNQSWRTGRIGT